MGTYAFSSTLSYVNEMSVFAAMFHIITLLSIVALFAYPSPVNSATTCRRIETVKHRGSTGVWQVPVWIWEPCGASSLHFKKNNPGGLPAVLFANGALIKASSYDGLARALASRGFVVLAAQYDVRPPPSNISAEAVADSLAAGFDCPPKPTLTSVSMLYTMARYARRHRIADVDHSVLFGHSYGSNVALTALLRTCDPSKTDLLSSLVCDGASGADTPPFRASVVSIFDGFIFPRTSIPAATLFLSMHSPFWNTSRFGPLDRIIRGSERAIDVLFADGTNHFAPNDFAAAFNHSKTNCSVSRQPPQDKFQTTAERQADVVRTIADVISLSYYSYRYGGDNVVPTVVKMLPRTQYVASAQLFSQSGS